MNHQLRDEELIQQYLHTRENDYFEVLYNRYASKVYRRCLSITKDVARAEDFTQDIFLRIYGNLNSFKGRSAFSTWLYSVSYNYCMDQLRHASRTPLVALDERQEFVYDDRNEQDCVDTQLYYLTTIMNTISPDEVRMIRLKYEDGLDVREIARQFRLNDSAVKMRLKRTRDKIRRLYQAQLS
ncbi:RNA polymerase sigma factor [Spirosoma rhododendri]|uniref:Sigma-70 family RNA polymerase sigma factor n=1 Tax=Spirosoma rhododendri TaxID=2728024 RepID=A0A7L5DNR2_9BACT|nr:sigma-70 family RNA polymerase sigma factor [Spirosoma rhododendri]QJD79715.1 sigma-70 family RNA polymerase sigma factor [Spirosoma rhododendri]